MSRKAISNCLAILGVLIALTLSFGISLVYGETMSLSLEGLRSSKGVVHVLVYDDATAFSETSATALAAYTSQDLADHKTSGDPLVIKLNNIPSGTYAIVLHHDENANNTLDMDGQVPLEGYGYSNNVGQFETPDFNSAAFTFTGEETIPSITMRYGN